MGSLSRSTDLTKVNLFSVSQHPSFTNSSSAKQGTSWAPRLSMVGFWSWTYSTHSHNHSEFMSISGFCPKIFISKEWLDCRPKQTAGAVPSVALGQVETMGNENLVLSHTMRAHQLSMESTINETRDMTWQRKRRRRCTWPQSTLTSKLRR